MPMPLSGTHSSAMGVTFMKWACSQMFATWSSTRPREQTMSAPLPFNLSLDLDPSSLVNNSDLGHLLSTTTGDKERGSPTYPLDGMMNTPLPQWNLEPWVDERDGIPLWQHYLAEELTRTIEFDKLCATTSAVFLDKLRASVALGPAVAPDEPSFAGALVRMVTGWVYGGGDARNPSADLQLALTREVIRQVESYSGWGAQLMKAYAFKQCVDSGEETWSNVSATDNEHPGYTR